MLHEASPVEAGAEGITFLSRPLNTPGEGTETSRITEAVTQARSWRRICLDPVTVTPFPEQLWETASFIPNRYSYFTACSVPAVQIPLR